LLRGKEVILFLSQLRQAIKTAEGKDHAANGTQYPALDTGQQ